jgi:hypothetical protein
MSDIPITDAPTPADDLNPRNAPIRKRRRYIRRKFNVRRKDQVHEAGVSEADPQRAEPPRVDADMAPEITRQSLEERQITTFDLPSHRKKPGWDYQWQVVTVYGEKVDRSILRDAHKAGWRPEKAKDWPELAEGLKPDDPLEEGGQMLLGRPMRLSNEAQLETYNKAKAQERDRMQAAMGGQAMGGHEGLANIRGVEVRNPSLQVELAIGSRR